MSIRLFSLSPPPPQHQQQHQPPHCPQPAVGREGYVNVRQTQRRHPLDAQKVEAVLRELTKHLGCAHMDVGVWLAGDKKVRELNALYRGMRKSTDILSFPFHEDLSAVDGDSLQDRMAARLYPPTSDDEDKDEDEEDQDEQQQEQQQQQQQAMVPEEDEKLVQGAISAELLDDTFRGDEALPFTEDDMNLGDMVVSVPYVVRAIQRDAKARASMGADQWAAEARSTPGVSGAMMHYTTTTTTIATTSDGAEEEAELRRCLEARIALLLVHGVCHLVGHDHESDEEHAAMTTEEGRLTAALEDSGLLALARQRALKVR